MLERSDNAATRTLFQEARRNGEFVGKADTRKAAARIFGKIAADYEGNSAGPAELNSGEFKRSTDMNPSLRAAVIGVVIIWHPFN